MHDLSINHVISYLGP